MRNLFAPRWMWLWCTCALAPLCANAADWDGTLPVEVVVGAATTTRSTDGTQLADLPFAVAQGYGFVDGRVESAPEALVLGGQADWPQRWRESVGRYTFRLPRGKYVVELVFLENEVAAADLRVFDVFAEDRPLVPPVDIAKLAGDFAWLRRVGIVSVFDGWLDLRFVSRTELPPRVSRLRISRVDSASSAQLDIASAPRLEVFAGAHAATLQWSELAVAADTGASREAQGETREAELRADVVGYGVFRSESRDGPFESLTRAPVPVPWFHDSSAPANRSLFYRVRAYSIYGGQSAYSNVVEARPVSVESFGLKTYELRIEPEDLAALARRPVAGEESAAVPARLVFERAVYSVFVQRDVESWGRRKGFRVSLDRQENRFFGRRYSLWLSPELDDPTRLRERLTSLSLNEAELAAATVEPIALVLNGQFHGLYHDIEVLDRRFVRRTRLDRYGLLAKFSRDDQLRGDWTLSGQKIGKNGAIIHLNLFVEELNRVGDGEFADYLTDNLYLDRFLRRWAMAAVRGEEAAPPAGAVGLKDSRNGRWEFFRQRHDAGDWGIYGNRLPAASVTPQTARAMLFGRTLQGGVSAKEELSVLRTRFLEVPAMRQQLYAAVEKALAEIVTEETLRRWVTESFETVRSAALADPFLVLHRTSRRRFLDGPEALMQSHRARTVQLRAEIARQRSLPAPALVLNEIFAGEDGKSDPWVELHNRSTGSVQLASFSLNEGFAASPVRLPSHVLEAGGYFVVRGDALRGVKLSRSGGILAVHAWENSDSGAGESRAAARLNDFVVYGRQAQRRSYGIIGDDWRFLKAPSPGGVNSGESAEALPYRYRQGVVRERDESFTIWLQAGFEPGSGAAAASDVELHYRENDSGPFQTVPLRWNAKTFRHQVSLAEDPERKRLAYYFLLHDDRGGESVYPLSAPNVTYFLPILPELQINEVVPRPLRVEGKDEFIEIHNPSELVVDIGGYFLTDQRGNPTKWRIPDGTTIAPKGFAVFYSSGASRRPRTNFRLSNSGEFVGLFGRLEEGNLLVDGIAFRGMKPGESWGRAADVSRSFRVWKDPTPGARNVPKIPKEFLERIEAEKKRERQKAETSTTQEE